MPDNHTLEDLLRESGVSEENTRRILAAIPAPEPPKPVPVPQVALPDSGAALTREDIHHMTAPEINANWDLVKEALRNS